MPQMNFSLFFFLRPVFHVSDLVREPNSPLRQVALGLDHLEDMQDFPVHQGWAIHTPLMKTLARASLGAKCSQNS